MEQKVIEKTVRTNASTDNFDSGVITVQIIHSSTQPKSQTVHIEI
jgi:hypothetical protein